MAVKPAQKDGSHMNRHIIKKGPTIQEMQQALFEPPSQGQGQHKELTFGLDNGTTIKVALTGCEREDSSGLRWNIKGTAIIETKSRPYKGYYDIKANTGHITID